MEYPSVNISNLEDFTFLPFFGTLLFLVMEILVCDNVEVRLCLYVYFPNHIDVRLDHLCLMLLFF